jgi:HEAT repeat protein
MSLEDWRKVVESCGLTVVRTPRRSLFTRLTAESGPVTVRLVEEQAGVLVLATIHGPPELAEVVIRREQKKVLGSRGIEVGDEIFDDTFLVKGSPPFVRALLNHRVRSLLLPAYAGPSLVGGELRLEVSEYGLGYALPRLVDLARQFAQSRDVPRCLAENVHTDPKPGVRRLSLSTLIEVYPGSPRMLEALRFASKDTDPWIRLRAGQALGAEGHGVLLSLAENVDDDALNAQAVAALGRALQFKRGRALLRRALSRRRTATAAACLEVLGKMGGVAVPILAEVMAREDMELAVLAARSLGATGDATAEPALVEALVRDDSDLQIAATAALGRVGSVESVLPLQEAAGRSLPGFRLRRAVHQAIAEIQARLQEAAPGQLSLADDEAGQLSFPSAEAGELSLATEPDGQLSFPLEKDSDRKKRTR